MFNWRKKPPLQNQPTVLVIRDALFGDRPLAQWPHEDSQIGPTLEPWASFVQARTALNAGSNSEAIRIWRDITTRPDLESRHYLQAWHFLREAGVEPTTEAKHIYGVVVEVAMPNGLDILAAYIDHHARYFNFSGAGVVWERPDNSLDGAIDALTAAGQTVANQIGPWTEVRPGPPTGQQVRVNMLTPSGLHFGQADMDVFANDAMAGPIIARATELMQMMIAKTEKGNGLSDAITVFGG